MIWALSILVALLLLILLLRAVFGPPARRAAIVSTMVLRGGTASPLMRSIAHELEGHPGVSGIHTLTRGWDAFAARRKLAQTATVSLDIQYYMWHADMTGRLLMRELLHAADRGVRVRLLIDDNTTAGTDAMLAAASAHPNLTIRLFNPYILRRFRLLNLIFDFRRLNRRMHNKSFTADDCATIVGGRNVGDEYFSAAQGMQFADLDVLAVGPIVNEVSDAFDAYWASDSAYPVEDILPAAGEAELASLRASLDALAASEIAEHFIEVTEDTETWRAKLTSDFDWVPCQLFVDDPAKGLGEIPRRKLLVTGLTRALGNATTSLDVVTAYFVPGRIGTTYFTRLSRAGRRVRVLTNSLASNDVVPVHAGYARYRRKLLRARVALYELKPGVAENSPKAASRKAKLRAKFGGSSSSLHAKMFIIDEKDLFVGSFNFDPRSLYINCEMGLLIHSPKLASQIARRMEVLMKQQSYTPTLEKGLRIKWADSALDDMAAVDAATLLRTEPESTWKQRALVAAISRLPIEWLL